jgi:hypothetical protein
LFIYSFVFCLSSLDLKEKKKERKEISSQPVSLLPSLFLVSTSGSFSFYKCLIVIHQFSLSMWLAVLVKKQMAVSTLIPLDSSERSSKTNTNREVHIWTVLL